MDPISRLRVLTLNIWNKQGPWERRLRLVREGIVALQPDLIGLQEVLHHGAVAPDQAEEIAADLGYHVAFAPAQDFGGGLSFGNAALSRWPIAASQHFALPGAGDAPDVPNSDDPRALLHCEIAAPFGTLPFFVSHLNWRFHHGAIRCRQVAFIAERIAELAPRGDRDRFPPILAADLNAEPASDEIRFLQGYHVLDGKSVYFADCHLAVGQGTGATYCRRNPYAAASREPDRRLDYLFVRGPDRDGRGEPLSCRVVFDAPDGEGVWPSDHFGVLAEISVVAQPLSVVA